MILDEDVMVGRTDLLGISEAGVEIPIRTPMGAAAAFGIMFAGGAGFVAFGVIDGIWILTGIGILLLLLFAYSAVAYLRRRSVALRLVLTPTGVVYEQPMGSVGVRWADVQGVALVHVSGVPHVGVEAPGEAVVQRDGSKRLMATNRLMSTAAIAVPASGLPGEPEVLLDALAEYSRDPGRLREPERERAALAARLA